MILSSPEKFLQMWKAQGVCKEVKAILTLRVVWFFLFWEFFFKLKNLKVLFPVNHIWKNCTNHKEILLMFFNLKKEDAIRNKILSLQHCTAFLALSCLRKLMKVYSTEMSNTGRYVTILHWPFCSALQFI